MNNRNNDLDVVRCFSNYLIILMHASAALQYCRQGGTEVHLWTFICGCMTQFALPALFLISGYLLFKNYTFNSYPKKISRRIKRLLVPYVVWNTTFVLFYLVCKNFVPRLNERVASFGLDSYSGIISKILDISVHPIDGPLWFLRTLFIFSLVSPLLYLILKSKKKYIRYSGFFIIGAVYVICYRTGVMYQLLMTYPLYAITLFYIGGLLATGMNGDKFQKFASNYWLILCLIGFTINALVVFTPSQARTPLYATFSDISKLMLTPGLFFVVSKMNIERLFNNKVFLFAKDMSFFAYAGHFLFCSMVMHATASLLGFMDKGKSTVLIMIFCMIGVPVMAGFYCLGKRIIPRIMRLFDGTL